MSLPQAYTVLKTLKASSMPELIEDLNNNFAQLLNIYAVRGLQGLQGNTGQGGSSGVRGASFMILDTEAFQDNFPSPSDPNEITIVDINNAIDQNPIIFFQQCTNFDDIVHNDMLILPNGIVVQYDSTTGYFIPTRLRLYNSQDTWTREEIIQLIEEYAPNGEGLYKAYSVKTKILADDSPNAQVINSVFNPNAVGDIATSNAGDGFESKAMQYIALQETAGIIDDNRVQVSSIDGHAVDYHEMVQNTLATSNLQSVPKPDAVPIKILLQNQHQNGLLMGSPSLGTLDKMAHIRKTSDSLELMPYYTQDGAFISANTNLSLSVGSANLRSKNVLLNATESSIDLQAGTGVRARVSADATTIYNKPYFDLIKKPAQSVMSVLPTGEGVTVGYKTQGTLDSLGSALPTENVIYKTIQDYVNSRLGWSTNETVKYYLDDIYSQLGALNTNLTTLNLIAGAFKGPNGAVLAYRGEVIPTGWQIVTDLRGRTIVGLNPNDVDFNTIRYKSGNKTIIQTVAQMPRHAHSAFVNNDWGGPYPSIGHSTGGNLGYTVVGGGDNGWSFSVRAEGGGQAMNIMNPFEVVNFIEFIG